jgi:NTP pyrophosphatase (non-canonical NTP hydrolase)
MEDLRLADECNLADLQRMSAIWQKHNFPDGKPYQPLLGVSEEVGELAHAHLKHEQGIRDVKQEDKDDAVGDIIIYLADYCNKNGIDMQRTVIKTWNEVSKRDWIKYPKNGKTE